MSILSFIKGELLLPELIDMAHYDMPRGAHLGLEHAAALACGMAAAVIDAPLDSIPLVPRAYPSRVEEDQPGYTWLAPMQTEWTTAPADVMMNLALGPESKPAYLDVVDLVYSDLNDLPRFPSQAAPSKPHIMASIDKDRYDNQPVSNGDCLLVINRPVLQFDLSVYSSGADYGEPMFPRFDHCIMQTMITLIGW